MKKLISLLICLIVIPALILGGALAAVYFTCFNPQPASYPYLHERAEITSIQFAEVNFEGGNVNTTALGLVDDVDDMMDDLASLRCHKGLSLDAISVLAKEASVSGLVINYSDGTYEVITAYVSVNSTLKITNLSELLSLQVYGYDVEAFGSLVEEHKGLALIK